MYLVAPGVAVLASLAVVGVVWLSALALIRPGGSRHRRCLANITRLERELFPEWFREFDGWSGHYEVDRPYVSKVDWLNADEFSHAPGAIWPVDSPNCVQVHAVRGTLNSGAYAADRLAGMWPWSGLDSPS